MRAVLDIFQGDSFTIGFAFPTDYDMSRLSSAKVYFGSKLYPHIIEGVGENIVKATISSEDTASLIYRQAISLTVEDTELGVKKIEAGFVNVLPVNSPYYSASESNVYSVVISVVVTDTALSTSAALYNVLRGQTAYEAAVAGGYTGTYDEFKVALAAAAIAVPYTGATNDVDLNEKSILVDSVRFEPTPRDIARLPYEMFVDSDNQTIRMRTPDGGDVDLGQEPHAYYRNNEGDAIVDGDVVSLSASPGMSFGVVLTDATDDTLSNAVMGMVTVLSIGANQIGRISKTGARVRGLNTSAWVEGTLLYVDPLNPGKLTNVLPVAPNHVIEVGVVAVSHVSQGVIELKINEHPKMVELSDVDGLTSAVLDSEYFLIKKESGIHQYMTFEDLKAILKAYNDTLYVAKETGKELIATTDLQRLSNTSGTNTGDQDLSALQPKAITPIEGMTAETVEEGLGELKNKTDKMVSVEAQTFTAAEKSFARDNISAISFRNILKNSQLLYLDDTTTPIRTLSFGGTPTITVEDGAFTAKMVRLNCKVGDRAQIRSGFTVTSGNIYSGGFFYKVVTGDKLPYLYDFSILTGNALGAGTVREKTFHDGWNFYARENATAGADYTSASEGFTIDFVNTTGTEVCEVLICMPVLIVGNAIPETVFNGTEFAFKHIENKFNAIEQNIDDVEAELALVDDLDWNIFPDASLLAVDELGNAGVRTWNNTGVSTFVAEKNIFAGQQIKITSPVGARAILLAPLNPEANVAYSWGFFYKVIAGSILPVDSGSIITSIAGNVSAGAVSVIDVKDGWKFYRRQNFSYNQASSNVSGLFIDFNNISASVTAQVLIALPCLIKSTTLNPYYPNGTFDGIINAFSRIVSLESEMQLKTTMDWASKKLALYGDSITAISNGDFVNGAYDLATWGGLLANYYGAANLYCRGVGSSTYKYATSGGGVVFVDAITGQYHSRDDNYNYDTYVGEIPAGTIKIRGAFSSWLRITSMFPASIKDTINAVIVMGATNDTIDATDVSWVESDATDPEWALSSQYANYNGDFNIGTLKGGIASTILKMQAWMPQALIIIATPLPGRGVTGEFNLVPITDEYTKSIYVRDIAKIFSIPVIDINAESGINGLNRPTYISDGLHPYSADGNKMLARTMIGGLKTINPKL